MAYDATAAAHYAGAQARAHSSGNCARYVREAIGHGGVSVTRTHYAKDYGRPLEDAGFYTTTSTPRKGDIAVIQPAPGHPDGHMAIYDGTTWISDFRQRGGKDGFYPGDAYRKARPSYKIYRHD